jgi:Peptidase_C39 like family
MSLTDFCQSQINKLNGYSISKICDLTARTTYFSQRDNYAMPYRTCNSSSNAMYLDWLLSATGRKRLLGDDEYLRNLLRIGDTIYHENQTACIKNYGFSTRWVESGNQDSERDFHTDRITELLNNGIPVVVNILHRGSLSAPRGGHIILLIANKQDEKLFLAHDPYGTLQSNYTDMNGNFSVIKKSEFYGRWQGGYRVLS